MGNWRSSRDVSLDVVAKPTPCNGSSPIVTDVTARGERGHTPRARITSCDLGNRWHSHFGSHAFQFLAVVVPEERRALNVNAELRGWHVGKKDEEDYAQIRDVGLFGGILG